MGILKGEHFIETRKHSLVSMATDRQAFRQASGKQVFRDGINQRATIKLKNVCQSFVDAVGGEAEIEDVDLLQKKLYFKNLDYVDHLKLFYYSKNSLFARVFDLIVEARYTNERAVLNHDMEIAVKQKGTMKNKEIQFISLDKTEDGKHLAALLNKRDLIKDRILHIEALDFKIKYMANRSEWMIGLGTARGSTVWSLIPPVLMLIEISRTDAIKVMELFQLSIAEIANFNTKRG